MTYKNFLIIVAVLLSPIWLVGYLIGFLLVPFYNGFILGFTTLKFRQEEKIKQYAEEIVQEEAEKLQQLYQQELKDAAN